MKQVIITVLCAFAALCGYAQEKSGHLLFKGVPIDGTVNSFVQKMKQKGFTLEGNGEQTAIMKGAFAGQKNCKVGIFRTVEKDLVFRVAVLFEAEKQWFMLEKTYLFLKEMLTKKYGKPSFSIEEFDSYSQPKDDMMKMLYAEQDRCKYGTKYETDEGVISLNISHMKIEYEDICRVVLVYTDNKNFSAAEESASDDL